MKRTRTNPVKRVSRERKYDTYIKDGSEDPFPEDPMKHHNAYKKMLEERKRSVQRGD